MITRVIFIAKCQSTRSFFNMKLPNFGIWNAIFNLFSSEKCQLATEQRKGELGVCYGVCQVAAGANT